jgi:RNA polymerase sigma-70 factor (ECF subfamily)
LPDNDHDLLSRCLRKEVAAEYRLYHRFAPRVYAICLRYGGNETEAEDILQNGFVRLFNSLDQFRFESSLDAWVYRIFIRTAVNYYKQNLKFSNEVELTDASDNVITGEDVISELSTRELLALIQRLPVGARTVFNLYVMEQCGHKEIAEMLGISEGTSKSQLSRAKSAIRRMLLEGEQQHKNRHQSR